MRTRVPDKSEDRLCVRLPHYRNEPSFDRLISWTVSAMQSLSGAPRARDPTCRRLKRGRAALSPNVARRRTTAVGPIAANSTATDASASGLSEALRSAWRALLCVDEGRRKGWGGGGRGGERGGEKNGRVCVFSV